MTIRKLDKYVPTEIASKNFHIADFIRTQIKRESIVKIQQLKIIYTGRNGKSHEMYHWKQIAFEISVFLGCRMAVILVPLLV